MIYSFDLPLEALVSIVITVLLVGIIVGHKFLPKPYDKPRETLITQLMSENLELKMNALIGRKGEHDEG